MSVYCTECGRILTQMCGDDTSVEVSFGICPDCEQNQNEKESTVN